jgi:L-histidine N-alpha-methyltransferase
MMSEFAKAVDAGLGAEEKSIPSKYFYDEAGSRIFQDIMQMPEYYLTDCEYEIFNTFGEDILKAFRQGDVEFDVIEFGAGDGYKTKALFRQFLQLGAIFRYVPVDISASILDTLEADMNHTFPQLDIRKQPGDYFDVLARMQKTDNRRKIVFFLGSNIGNFSFTQAVAFFQSMGNILTSNDRVFIGFDLIKSPQVIIDAYDDPHGHTRRFNLNLLKRINRELGANFNTGQFQHYAIYNPELAVAKSYIVSKTDQAVHIPALGKTYTFAAWETIYVEMSQKYDQKRIAEIAAESGFNVLQNFYDRRRFFVNSLWQKY